MAKSQVNGIRIEHGLQEKAVRTLGQALRTIAVVLLSTFLLILSVGLPVLVEVVELLADIPLAIGIFSAC